MVSPTNFKFNEEAFLSNKFQQRSTDDAKTIKEKALGEFKTVTEKLTDLGVDVIVYEDDEEVITPDAVFPNNWISTSLDGKLFTYPMAVPNRRAERNENIIEHLCLERNYKQIDYAIENEKNGVYLEGTGSIIFDHINKVAYAAISPRTDKNLFEKVVVDMNYKPVSFTAFGKEKELIYHTNVMLSIGVDYALIGLETINEEDKKRVLASLSKTGREIIELSNEQIYNSFAGNMIQLENNIGETILVLSQTAYESLSEGQLELLKTFNDHICQVAIPTIEKIGGGSARCMIAEIF
jgi:hypothetical protein